MSGTVASVARNELSAFRSPRRQHDRRPDGPEPRRELPRLGGPARRAARPGRARPALRQPRRSAASSRARCAPSSSTTPSRSSPTSPACSRASTTCCARTSTCAAVASEIEAMVVTLRGDRRRRDHGHVPRPRAGEPARQPRRAPGPAPERDDPRSRRPSTARSSSTSRRIRSPPTAGCGTSTACTRTPRATGGSRSPPPRRWASTAPTRAGPPAFDDPLGPRTRIEHAVWAWKYLRPWLIRRMRGVSSGDGLTAKRPTLEPIG